MLRRILVAVDSGAPATRAVETAVELAGVVRGLIGVLHVVDTSRAFHPDPQVFDDQLMAQLREEGDRILEIACARIPQNINVERLREEGDPAQTILDIAQCWAADLIVIGTDARGRLAHFLLGSTADTVIRRAPCPVITVRVDAKTGSSKRTPEASVA